MDLICPNNHRFEKEAHQVNDGDVSCETCGEDGLEQLTIAQQDKSANLMTFLSRVPIQMDTRAKADWLVRQKDCNERVATIAHNLNVLSFCSGDREEMKDIKERALSKINSALV